MINQLGKKRITATVINMEWERIHLHLYVKVEVNDTTLDLQSDSLSFYLVNKDEITSPAKCKVLGCEDQVYHLHLNVTNNGENWCIPSGRYMIEVVQKDVALADCEAGRELVPRMEECSRNFLYSNGVRAYTVTFDVEEGDEILPFEMITLASGMIALKYPSRGRMRDKIHPVRDITTTWLGKKNMIRAAYQALYILNKGKRSININELDCRDCV